MQKLVTTHLGNLVARNMAYAVEHELLALVELLCHVQV
jgi:hypothetical protein